MAKGWRALVLLALLALLACGRGRHRRPMILDLVEAFPLAEVTVETRRLVFAQPQVRSHLLEGFSIAEGLEGAEPFVWGIGERSRLRFTVLRPRTLVARLRARSVPGIEGQEVEVLLNGEPVGTLRPGPQAGEMEISLPGHLLRRGPNLIDLSYRLTRIPGGRDRRPLAVAWFWLELQGEDPPARSAPRVVSEGLLLPADTRLDYYLRAPAGSELRFEGSSGGVPLRVSLRSDDFEAREIASFEGRRGPTSLELPLSEETVVGLRIEAGAALDGDATSVLERPRVVGPAVGARGSSAAKIVAPPPFLPPRPRPNVLLYLVDTLRADRLGSYGSERGLTPHMDRLAETGVLFERALAQSSWTRASVASLLTGVWPATHGTNGRREALPAEASTLAELLREAGYATAAVVTNPNVHRRFGFDQGFDEYVQVAGTAPPREVRREALGWLERLAGRRPFLLYVHTVEPHDPYAPPPDLRRRFASAVPSGMTGEPGRNQEVTAALVNTYASLYEAEVAWSDRAFGELLAGLRRLELAEETLVVLVSDHGEEFQEHGGWKHGVTLHAEVLDVPLLMSGPGLPAGERISEPVQHVDLLPTLLEYLGLEAPKGLEGRSLLSLLPGAPGGGAPPPVFSYLELDGAPRMSVVAGEWKLIQRRVEGAVVNVDLYCLRTDPGETRNLAPSRPILASYLGSLITARLQASTSLRASEVELDDELEQSLRALGYL